MSTFIVDCPICKAKVAAKQEGIVQHGGYCDEAGEPYGDRLVIGKCPRCSSLIAGVSEQIAWAGYQGDEEEDWSDVVRVYPKPTKTFSSFRIPHVVKQSLDEGEKSMQAGANIAACVMFGRALEAVCQDVLSDKSSPDAKTKPLMLGVGIKQLKDKNIIDQRLFDWSQQLQAFRNIAAHPEGTPISREDSEDLQAFVYAIIEYIYDLTDRYEEFKARIAKRDAKRK